MKRHQFLMTFGKHQDDRLLFFLRSSNHGFDRCQTWCVETSDCDLFFFCNFYNFL